MLGTRLAGRLGLPTTPVAVVQVSEELILLTPEVCVELPRARVPCTPGLQFASRYPGDPHRVTMLDFLPDEMLTSVANLREFAGMLAFECAWQPGHDARLLRAGVASGATVGPH